MKKFIIIFSTLVSFHWAISQNYVDIARLYFNGSAQNKFANSTSSTRVTEMGFDITYPIVLNEKSTLLTGFAYDRIELKLHENANYSTVSSATLRIGINKIHSDKLSGTYLLIPKLASDFQQSSPKNFQFGALALLRFTKSERFNYKAGLYLNSELFGPFVVPILGLYYLNASEKLEANIVLPQLVDVNYKMNKVLHAGMIFTGQIRSYRLEELPAFSQGRYLVRSSNDISAYLKFNIANGLSLQTRVGYSVGRTYKIFSERDKIDFAISFIKVGDSRGQLNTVFEDGLVYQAVLLYRFVKK